MPAIRQKFCHGHGFVARSLDRQPRRRGRQCKFFQELRSIVGWPFTICSRLQYSFWCQSIPPRSQGVEGCDHPARRCRLVEMAGPMFFVLSSFRYAAGKLRRSINRHKNWPATALLSAELVGEIRPRNTPADTDLWSSRTRNPGRRAGAKVSHAFGIETIRRCSPVGGGVHQPLSVTTASPIGIRHIDSLSTVR